MMKSTRLALAAMLAFAPAAASAQTAPVLRTVAISYAKLPASDGTFRSLWTLDPRRVDMPNYPPEAYVGYVREAGGSLLTVTLLQAPEECGPNRCSMKIFRDGKLVKQFVGCDDTSNHRITADGSALLICDATIPLQ